MRRQACRALALAIALTGCLREGDRLPPAAWTATPQASPALVPQDLRDPTWTGAVRLKIRWPSRAPQFLPISAEAIDFEVFRGEASTPLARSTARRAGGEQSVTLTRLPVGDLRVEARAKDAEGRTVAHASGTVVVRGNALADARLSMQPAEPLAITSFSPTSGIPGPYCQINIDGTGFMLEAPASYSVRIGTTEIPASRIFRLYPFRFAVLVPWGVQSGPVTLRMGSYSVQSSESFTAIASVSISPLTATLAPGATTSFALQAYDAEGRLVEKPAVHWYMENERCIGNICEDSDAAKVNQGLVTAERDVGFFNYVTGTYKASAGPVAQGDMVVGNPYVRASASIFVIIP